MQEVLQKLVRYEIKIRKALQTHTQGSHRSLFKGSGLTFDDVRAYQYGDDVRTIHWMVSSKGHGLFVKTFHEEKEQTVFFIVDVSASQDVGRQGAKKLATSREVCATLALSALEEGSQVGLLLFSNKKEGLVRPRKGRAHIHSILHTLYHTQPTSLETQLSLALRQGLELIKRTSMFVIISDFIDQNYTDLLRAMTHKHDVILVHIHAKQEQTFPRIGILPFRDPETRRTRWIHTNRAFEKKLQNKWLETRNYLQEITQRYGASYVDLSTEEEIVGPLIKLFEQRRYVK